MLNKIDTVKAPYILYRVYNNFVIIFDDVDYLKQESQKIDNDNSFLLKNATINFFEGTPMIEMVGSSIDINKYKENGSLDPNNDWRLLLSNYVIITTPSKTTGQQILNG